MGKMKELYQDIDLLLSKLPKGVVTGPQIRDTLQIGNWDSTSWRGTNTSEVIKFAIAQGKLKPIRIGHNGRKPSLYENL